MVFLFNKSTLLSLILAILRFKVLVFTKNKSFSFSKIERISPNVLGSLIKVAEYHHINHMEPDVFNGDYRNKIKSNVESISESTGFLKKISQFFPSIENADIKSKVFLHRYISDGFLQQEKNIHWLENSVYKDNYIINFTAMRPGMKYFWKNSNLRVANLFNYTTFFSIRLINILNASIYYLRGRASFFLSKNKTLTKVSTNNEINNKNFDVLFFPHAGLNMNKSGHPPKDHFYSKDIQSPFHPSNILHLEYDKRVDVDKEIPHIKKYLSVDDFHYKKLIIGKIKYSTLIKLVFELISNTKWFNRNGFGNKILHITLISAMYSNFIKFKDSINSYSDSKIALVGYDMLFPIGLSLALEHYKIHTVAAQERLLPPITNDQAYILHTYLNISNFHVFDFGAEDDIYVKNRFAVGQIRTDHFFDNFKSIKKLRELRVIFLDYQIGTKDQQQFSPFLNWKNDIKLRNDILDLAEMFPNVEFIFRGKDCNWLNNEFHHEVIIRAKRLENVVVDTNYDENFRSYHLCASADLIIARPTSLAEECVSAGMNVIVLDYGINYHNQVSRWIPELKDYHCHSFDHLKNMMSDFIKKGFIVSESEKNLIKERIFSNLTDGNVRNRVLSNLEIIYSKIH
tara:strand:- start:1810 stop:3690 length:1881 start_codon:yes stop_codon:yes gene_type:complete